MRNIINFICTLVILIALFVPSAAISQRSRSASNDPIVCYNEKFFGAGMVDDFDPLVENIIVTVTVKEIRALDTINRFLDPDFYIKIFINDNEFISDIWENSKYVEKPNWNASCEVPKNIEFVDIYIELWSKCRFGTDHLWDLSPLPGETVEDRRVEITYSIATGIWWGDDYLGDPSGYGRLNGCDDGTIYQNDRDAELFFSISQNDFDKDGIPFWLEENVYNTCPTTDNSGEDLDGDGVPIEWEYKFGLAYHTENNQTGYHLIYDPNLWEDHYNLDPDNDGLTNWEEYMTSQWGSDPFMRDIFIEIDQMEIGPNGQGAFVPTQAFDLVRDSHARQNIVWHIDDGRLGGGEIIPFKKNVEQNDLRDWYWDYFMHGDENNWRRGVFRWCVVSYDYIWAPGFTFPSFINDSVAIDCFFFSTKYHEFRSKIFPIIEGFARGTFNRDMAKAYVYAGVIMHETGHTLNIRAPGVDVSKSYWPWQIKYWQFAAYKSCMNYRYIYRGVIDYSDGSRGGNDYDDWSNINLTYFNPREPWW